MKMIDTFTNLYPVTKTLRFKLIPVGKTEEHFVNKQFLEEDEKRAEDYKKVKEFIDRYHKIFIERILSQTNLLNKDLDSYSDLYFKSNKTDSDKSLMTKLEGQLRKQISQAFNQDSIYGKLWKKEMLKELLPEVLTDEEEVEIVRTFDNFWTYFIGFSENRKNMYSDEEKSTAIAYRCINENLPKFLDNTASFKRISDLLDNGIFRELNNNILQDSIFVVEDFFSVDYFNYALSETGIELYNLVLGGYTKDDGTKIKGLNEYINLYNQQLAKEDRKLRLPKLKALYKQILSDRETVSFIPEQFENDNQVIKALYDYCDVVLGHSIIDSIANTIVNLKSVNLDEVYYKNGSDISRISIGLNPANNWNTVRENWNAIYDSNSRDKNKSSDKYLEKRTKAFKAIGSFSLSEISTLGNGNCVDYLVDTVNRYIEEIKDRYSNLKNTIDLPYESDKSLSNNKNHIELIKDFLDAVKRLESELKPLLGTTKEENKDEVFYGEFIELYEQLITIDALYNKIRNYATKKVYSSEKFKLNFRNSQLLGGWEQNKIPDYHSVLFRKDQNYYLGIIDKSNSRLLNNLPEVNHDEDCYEEMIYKQLQLPHQMLPKVFFAKANINYFMPSDEILRIREKESFKKGDNFNKSDCAKFIDFFQKSISIHKDWKNFGFEFKKPDQYNDISEFYNEVNQQGYSIKFKPVPCSLIEEFVNDGKLYLFQIYNKDFSTYSKGTPNLHTLYFKMLFNEENLKNVVYKLNGEAEMFYRKPSIRLEEAIIHKANEKVKNKNPNNPKPESVFPYDLIKDKRYTAPQFMFHVPITMNFKSEGSRINELVRKAINEGKCNHIIGIDRGERNLLYICVIDKEGRIVEQRSMNIIESGDDSVKHTVDYHDLLDRKETERKKARQSWTTIESIKNIKEGYLSQAIKLICEWVVKYDAIIIMEDLNSGFKNSRVKVEKQVYQKFEKMLIDKLNYLADKKAAIDSTGGLLHAYQLTENFSSFRSIGRQNGIIFYVPAWLTSKIDPVTGFVDLLKPHYSSVETSKDFISKFDCISYLKDEDMFMFSVDYSHFPKGDISYRTKWELYSNGSRIDVFRNPESNNEWDNREVVLTQEFKNLFSEFGIDYLNSENLINNLIEIEDKTFWVRFIKLISLVLQMRNSITGQVDVDYIISPVKDGSGKFYCSQSVLNNLPQDADANGAFNIARKGLWVVEQLIQADDLKNVNLAISNKEWLKLVQSSNE